MCVTDVPFEMSCNGCRVLRKGCSENCALRPCLQWIESPEAQGYATVFVAKFFGRAGLMEFISAVPETERTALFQSLLYEACGRTVNPVYGAIGLLWSGNWRLCQEAVESVLKGGAVHPTSSTSTSNISTSKSIDLNPLLSLSTMPYPTTTLMRENAPSAQQSPALPNISKYAPSVFRSIEDLSPKNTVEETRTLEAAKDLYHAVPSRRSSCGKQEDWNDPLISRSCMSGPIIQQLHHNAAFPTLLAVSNSALPFAITNNTMGTQNMIASHPMMNIRVRRRMDDHVTIARRTSSTLPSTLHKDTSTENVHSLDLNLGLNSSHSPVQSATRETTLQERCTRVSSPSTISFNSEGSVTNFVTPDFTRCSCHHDFQPPQSRQSRDQNKLLDLLL